jgi:hypothetical protein
MRMEERKMKKEWEIRSERIDRRSRKKKERGKGEREEREMKDKRKVQ